MFSRKEINRFVDEIWEANEDVIDLGELCEKKMKSSCPQITPLQIGDVLDDFVVKVKSAIKKKITDSKNRSIPPNYDFDNSLPNLLLNYSSKVSENARIAHLRRYSKQIKSAIKNMHWKIFQRLCRHLLEINGVTRPGVTRGTKEGGIDFYGLLHMDKYTSSVFLKGLKVRIIGQAKHHSTNAKVGEGEVRKFLTQCGDFQSGRGRGAKVVPSWFSRISIPVVGIVVTNTNFTKDAKKYAERNAIILKDGEQVIEDLIHSPKSDDWFSIDGQGNKAFDETSFQRSFEK